MANWERNPDWGKTLFGARPRNEWDVTKPCKARRVDAAFNGKRAPPQRGGNRKHPHRDGNRKDDVMAAMRSRFRGQDGRQCHERGQRRCDRRTDGRDPQPERRRNQEPPGPAVPNLFNSPNAPNDAQPRCCERNKRQREVPEPIPAHGYLSAAFFRFLARRSSAALRTCSVHSSGVKATDSLIISARKLFALFFATYCTESICWQFASGPPPLEKLAR